MIKLDLLLDADGYLRVTEAATRSTKKLTRAQKGVGKQAAKTEKAAQGLMGKLGLTQKQAAGLRGGFTALGGIASRLGQFMGALTHPLAAVTAGLAAFGFAMVGATKQAAALETNIAEVATLLPETTRQMGGVRDAIIDLSRGVPDPPPILTKALYQAVSAGAQDTAEALRIVEVASRAAVAGVSDTATATSAITTALNAYGLGAEEATRISDVLFTGVREGVLTFNTIAGALGTYSATAAQVGVSIEETTAAMAALTKGGLDANVAATALNATMLAFVNPSAEAAELAEKLGIDLSVATLRSEGLAGAMDILMDAVGDSPELMVKLVGNVRSYRAAAILAGKGSADFAQALEAANNSAGATEEAFRDMADTAGHLWSILKSELGAAMTELGTLTLPIVKAALSGTITVLKESVDMFKGVGAIIAGLGQGGNLEKIAEGFRLLSGDAGAEMRELAGATDDLGRSIAALPELNVEVKGLPTPAEMAELEASYRAMGKIKPPKRPNYSEDLKELARIQKRLRDIARPWGLLREEMSKGIDNSAWERWQRTMAGTTDLSKRGTKALAEMRIRARMMSIELSAGWEGVARQQARNLGLTGEQIDEYVRLTGEINKMTEAMQAQGRQTDETVRTTVTSLAALTTFVGTALGAMRGHFDEATAKMADAVGGLISSMEGVVAAFAAGPIAGIAALLSALVGSFGQVDGGRLAAALKPLADALRPLIDGIGELVTIILESLKPVFEGLKPVFEALKPVFEAVGTVLQALSPLFELLGGALEIVAIPLKFIAGIVKAVADGFKWLVDKLGPLAPLLAAVAVAAAGIGGAFSGLGGLAVGAFNAIWSAAQWLAGALGPVWDGIKWAGSAIWDGIRGAAQLAWEGIKWGWDLLKAGLGPVWDGIKAAGSIIWDGIKGAAELAWTGIKAGAQLLAAGLSAVWTGIKAGASVIWSGLVAAAELAFAGVKAAAGLLVQGLGLLWGGIKTAFSAAVNALPTILSAVGSALSTVGGAIVTGITAAWGGIKAAFSAAVGALPGIFSAIGGALSTVASTIGGIVGAAGPIGLGILALGGVLTAFGLDWGKVWDGVKSVVGTVAGAVVAPFKAIAGLFGSTESAAQQFFDKTSDNFIRFQSNVESWSNLTAAQLQTLQGHFESLTASIIASFGTYEAYLDQMLRKHNEMLQTIGNNDGTGDPTGEGDDPDDGSEGTGDPGQPDPGGAGGTNRQPGGPGSGIPGAPTSPPPPPPPPPAPAEVPEGVAQDLSAAADSLGRIAGSLAGGQIGMNVGRQVNDEVTIGAPVTGYPEP